MRYHATMSRLMRTRVAPIAALLVAVSCGGGATTRMEPMIVTGAIAPTAPANRPVWVVGYARNAKQGAMIDTNGLLVLCAERAAWPDDILGLPILVAGSLATTTLPEPPVGPLGERSAGASGELHVLSGCSTPPAGDDGLLATEEAIFAALTHRDADALGAIVAAEFVFRAPGQPDTDRAGFLAAVAGIPGEILSVVGEDVTAHRAGDTGIVRGRQVARVRLSGQEIEDRGHFVDVFVRRDGRWVMTLALTAPALTGPSADPP